MFDILPLIVETADGKVSVHEVPTELAHEVEIEHPTIEGLAELGLRWWGFPSICDNVLSIGGINYPLAPFTGWYLAPEISARDFTDTYRYNLLPEIARGARHRDLRRALAVEGPRGAGDDDRGAALLRQGRHPHGRPPHGRPEVPQVDRPRRRRRAARSRPSGPGWSRRCRASLSPNFHREFEDVFKLPALIRRPALDA